MVVCSKMLPINSSVLLMINPAFKSLISLFVVKEDEVMREVYFN
jgi:hypothetical protein